MIGRGHEAYLDSANDLYLYLVVNNISVFGLKRNFIELDNVHLFVCLLCSDKIYCEQVSFFIILSCTPLLKTFQ